MNNAKGVPKSSFGTPLLVLFTLLSHFFSKKIQINFQISRKTRIFATQNWQVFKKLAEKRQMTKADIINEITETTGLQKRDVAVVVEGFMEAIKNSLLQKRENVYLRGFGSFIVKHRAAKTARNIQKNTTITIEAHDQPSFKPAKSFIEQMK